jgi:hypothetical protein
VVVVARSLTRLLIAFDIRKRAWCQDRLRAQLLNRISAEISWLDRYMVRTARFNRVPFATRAVTIRRYRSAAAFVNGIAVELSDARTAEAFEALTTALRTSVVEIVQGNWDQFAGGQELPRESVPRHLARRILPPMVLFSTAMLLPHIPAVTVDPAALTTFQVGLVAAGLLSLTPLDDGSRKHILSAFEHSSNKDN